MSGRNVDIKLVDKLQWNIEQVKVPDALMKRPFQHSDELVKQVYFDLDNPAANLSLESGEILCFGEMQYHSDDQIVDNVSTKCESAVTSQENKQQTKEDKITEDYTLSVDNRIIHEVVENVKVSTAHQSATASDSVEASQNSRLNDEPDVPKHGTILQSNKNEVSDNVSQTEQLSGTLARTLTSKEMVEGDLELSDETSDNTDLQKLNTTEQTDEKVSFETTNTIKETENNVSENDFSDNSKQDINKSNKNNDNRFVPKQSLVVRVKLDNSNANKKNKTKKKSQKHKNAKETKKLQENTEVFDKYATKGSEEIKVSKEVKSKFCDLFGDSSSLITPEDLGLVPPHGQTHIPSPKYVPIFEDAQDAIDLLPNEKKNVQEQLNKREIDPIEESKDTTQVKSKSKSSKKLDSNCKNKKIRKNDEKAKKNDEKSKKDDENTNKNDDKSFPESGLESHAKSNGIQILPADADVVKTVIISTGVQPIPVCTDIQLDCLLEKIPSNTSDIEYTLSNINSYQSQNYTHTTAEALLKALATSTPAKVPPKILQANVMKITNDVIDTSMETKATSAHSQNITPAMDQTSDSNTIDSYNDTDVPDIRIFVRRRRKGKKKVTPPET